MNRKSLLFAVIAASTILPALPSFAQGGYQEYVNRPTRGSTIRHAAEVNAQAPGDANELAPDTKQSATGGPSGGFGRGTGG